MTYPENQQNHRANASSHMNSDDVQNKASPDKVRAYISWTEGRGRVRRPLKTGRHLIGNSPFASIQTPGHRLRVDAALLVDERSITLKCLHPDARLTVDGQNLSQGRTVAIGDLLEFNLGTKSFTVAASVGSQSYLQESPVKQKNKAASTLQDQVTDLVHDTDRLRHLLASKLLRLLDADGLDLSTIDSPEIQEAARLKLRKLIADLDFRDNQKISRFALETQVFDEVMGLGPLEPLLADESVTEIMVNARDQIFVERAGTLSLSDTTFSSDQALLNVIERIVSTVGRRIDLSSPIVDARLLDGSRVNAVIPPLALRGPCLTIRRFSKDPIRASQLVQWGSMTQGMALFLEKVVQSRKNLMISGGTGSGKTTLLNALSNYIPAEERVCTVEDAAELQLQRDHVISLESRPPNLEGSGAITIRDLVKNTLRMRPDRIIVGECRGGEALDMLQAMNTGHDGSMTTAHANTPIDMLRRLETMVLMAGVDLPLSAIREQVASALTVIVQQSRWSQGRRLVTDISWVKTYDRASGEYDIDCLFSRTRSGEPEIHVDTLRIFAEHELGVRDVQPFILDSMEHV